MRNTTAILLPLLLGAVLTATSAGGPVGGALELTRTNIGGSATGRITGGLLELSGTTGQHHSGLLSGGTLSLTGGFWFGIPAGDCEDDGDVDLADHVLFGACLTGPDRVVAQQCRCFDVDQSGAVDLQDFATAQVHHGQ